MRSKSVWDLWNYDSKEIINKYFCVGRLGCQEFLGSWQLFFAVLLERFDFEVWVTK